MLKIRMIAFLPDSQKAPSTIRCIKTRDGGGRAVPEARAGQKAPSTIRCIKTENLVGVRRPLDLVRKHRAP